MRYACVTGAAVPTRAPTGRAQVEEIGLAASRSLELILPAWGIQALRKWSWRLRTGRGCKSGRNSPEDYFATQGLEIRDGQKDCSYFLFGNLHLLSGRRAGQYKARRRRFGKARMFEWPRLHRSTGQANHGNHADLQRNRSVPLPGGIPSGLPKHNWRPLHT